MPTLHEARAWYPASDPVHGFDHIERVYRLAEHLAEAAGADIEIVRSAALLHDAHAPGASEGEPAERFSHHYASSDFAARVLAGEGWPEERIQAVQHCIRAHRFRDQQEPPSTLEAQVLFDADKLDAIGAVGIARAIAFAARLGLPAYAPPSERFLRSGQLEEGEAHSAYHEYVFKLRQISDRLYTPAARRLAASRQQLLDEYFARLAAEAADEQPLG